VVKPPSPANELLRLQKIAEYGLDGGPRQPELQRIARLAASVCETPIALVTIVGESEQRFFGNVGMEGTPSTSREVSFCGHTIAAGSYLAVEDAKLDARFRANPLVTGAPGIRSYFAVPLIVEEDIALGTLCVIDTDRRQLSAEQKQSLSDLGSLIIELLEARRIKEQTGWFGKLLEASDNEIYVIDPDNLQFLYVNEGALQNTGYTRQELTQLSPLELQPEESHEAFEQTLCALRSGEVPSALFETQCLRKDGSRYPALARMQCHEGDPTVITAVVTDISEKREMDSKLALYREVFNHASVGIVIADAQHPDYPILHINEAFEEITGYSSQECVGRNCRFLQADDRSQAALNTFRDSLRSRQPATATIRNYRKSGEMFWNEIRVYPIRGRDGDVTHLVGMQTDVTERVSVEEELDETRTRLQEISDGVPALIAYVDPQQVYQFMNQGYRETFGIPEGRGIGESVLEVLGGPMYQQIEEKILGSLAGVRQQFEIRESLNAIPRDLEVTYLPHWNSAGTAVLGIYILATDQTRRRDLERALFEAKEISEKTLDSIADGVISTNAEGRIQYMNPVAEQTTGWTRVQAQNMPIDLVLQLLDGSSGTSVANPVLACLNGSTSRPPKSLVVASREGRQTPIEISPSLIRTRKEKIAGAIAVIRDVTESRRAIEQLHHSSQHDTLTGLPNRALLLDRIDQAILRSAREKQRGALLFIDLDNFKEINDLHGHGVGDQVLCRFSRRLSANLREVDTVSRLGGDEFVVLLSGLDSRQDIEGLVDKMSRISRRPYKIGALSIEAHASIGWSEFPYPGMDAQQLLESADREMYTAKALNKRTRALGADLRLVEKAEPPLPAEPMRTR